MFDTSIFPRRLEVYTASPGKISHLPLFLRPVQHLDAAVILELLPADALRQNQPRQGLGVLPLPARQQVLEPGGFAVMVSDGVADPGRDEWLQDLLAGWEGEDPQVLAGLILSESIRREALQDDCGVQVLYLPKTGGLKKV